MQNIFLQISTRKPNVKSSEKKFFSWAGSFNKYRLKTFQAPVRPMRRLWLVAGVRVDEIARGINSHQLCEL